MAVSTIDPDQIDFSLSSSLAQRIMPLSLLLLGILCVGHAQTISTTELVPPPLPEVKPVVLDCYSGDKDGNRIHDALEMDHLRYKRLPRSRSSSEKANLLHTERKDVDVQLIFNTPITQQQIDDFLLLGGEITYIYKAVSYGWTGRVPSSSLDALPDLMGSSLVLVHKPGTIELQMNRATKSGRVRPIWSHGFAGNPSGFDGDPTIAIGIVDTGVDGSHLDLVGRNNFWAEIGWDGHVLYGPTTSPSDNNGHGSHVAGIAVGSGLASCSLPSTLCYTQSQSNPSFFQLGSHRETMITFSSHAFWIPKASATLVQFQRALAFPELAGYLPNSATGDDNDEGLFITNEFEMSDIWQYGVLLDNNDVDLEDYVIANSVEGYFDANDLIRLKGVAPGCNWAAVKLYENNEGRVAGTEIGIDVLVEARRSNNIKIINLSLGTTAEDGIVTRLLVNNTARSGILVVAAAGNIVDDESRPVHDPARAALALTVGAANSKNMLTDYSSHGRDNINGNDSTLSEDFKPDLIAPGGSVRGSTIYGGIISVDSGTSDGMAFPDIEPNDYTEKNGTSSAAPFAAGCAGLVIDALQRRRIEEGYEANEIWTFDSSDDALFVKMVLCATATETNKAREDGQFNPTLERADRSQEFPNYPPGKDPYEGYGMINPDAAVEAVYRDYHWGEDETDYLGDEPKARRAWARRVYMLGNEPYRIFLENPATGDFDLYLYDIHPSPTGTPIIIGYSTNSEKGASERIEFRPDVDTHALLVVKHISGEGQFAVHAPVPSASLRSFLTDSDLKVAVEKELRVLDPNYSDMLRLTELDLSRGSIESIEGLQYAQNLEKLELYINNIVDLSPLAGLTDLRHLSLHYNQIVDLSPLAGLTNLSTLLLSENQIVDISPLAGLTHLTWLTLGKKQFIGHLAGRANQIADISPLAELTNLEILDLSDNQIVDISPLAELTNIRGLRMSNNQIVDISLLAGLTKLNTLDLSVNQIVDISPLTELTYLSWLELTSNRIVDLSGLSDFQGFSFVGFLFLRGNPLSEEARDVQIPEFSENNPGVSIAY